MTINALKTPTPINAMTLNTPNKKVVTVNYNDLDVSKWNDFIPETEFVLNISKAGGYFFARYMM